MTAIKTPEEETLLQIGDQQVYVFEIEEDCREYGEYGWRRDGRTRLTCHDDDGNEVEILFYPYEEEED